MPAAALALGVLAWSALAQGPAPRAVPPRPKAPAAVPTAIPGKAAGRAAYASDFVAGDGQALARRACLLCHSAFLTTQQAKDSTGWEKTLVQMEKWGVSLTAAEHDTLRRYLLAHFGPRPK